MTLEQVTEQIMKQSSDISAIREKLASAHKRIDENDRITEGIHKLASNVESLALQIKLLTESVETNIERLEGSLKTQGERIGALEKEPANKWKSLVSQIISLLVAAVVGGVIGGFIK